MAVNINVELFKRYKPEKKLDLIYQLNADELLATTPETIKRIVKETGKRLARVEIKYFVLCLKDGSIMAGIARLKQ